MKSIRSLGLSALFTAVSVFAAVHPEQIDQPQSLLSFYGVFFFFLIWFASLLGVGSFLFKQLRLHSEWDLEPIFYSLALGSLFYSSFAGLAALGLPFQILKPIFCSIIFGGGFLFIEHTLPVFQKATFKKLNGLEKFLVLTLLLNVILRVMEGFGLHGHGDPLICYLTANRHFAQTGSFEIFKSNPIYFFSSSWENLFLWGNLFFTQSSSMGLASGQRFGQWITALIAHSGTLMGVILISLIFFKNRSFALLAALLASNIPVLRWMQNLSKNDLGVLFWALSGFLFLFQNSSKRGLCYLLSGLFLGASVIGKFSNASLLVFLLIWMLGERVSIKGLFMVGIGGFMGALPVLLRNFEYADNPFFPWLREIFQDQAFGPSLSQSFLKSTAVSHTHFNSEYLIEFIKEQYWMIFLSVAPMVAYLKRDRKFLVLSLAIIAQVLFYLTFFRSKTELRYLNVGLVLSSLCALGTLFAIIEKYRYRERILLLASVMALFVANLPFFTLAQVFGPKYQTGTQGIEVHSAGIAKKWLRQNHPGAKILALGDNEPYYMLSEHYIINDYDRFVDEKLEKSAESQSIISDLNASGFQFILDFLPNPQGPRRQKIRDELLKNRIAKVYEDQTTVIYDIRNNHAQ